MLIKKISDGTVRLIPFSDMTAANSNGGDSPFANDVRNIISEVLMIEADRIGGNDHIFHDLGATSIQYFDILTRLSQKFSITDYKQDDKYCYTLNQICEYLEKCV